MSIENNNSESIINKMNAMGMQQTPFLFIIDFEMQTPLVLPLNTLSQHNISYYINSITNSKASEINVKKKIIFKKKPILFPHYQKAFNSVINNILYGNSFLLNLTFPTEIQTNYTLKEIYNYSRAKYKLYFNDKFVVFSPETFIRIEDRRIYTHPMKGTIDAALPNAKQQLLSNPKEYAEHVTIVDLLRNDLSMVANDVRVDKFRYVEEIKISNKNLLQVSSIISGKLPDNFASQIGDIIFALLPAGSICGAPKKKTVEIIKQIEAYKRGYYTGIFGYFDGEKLDSGVMIRFIENKINAADTDLYNYTFKSGGGITMNSDVCSEYNEMIDKIYIPINQS